MKKLSRKVVKLLTKKKLKISFAESCTGGLLSNSITSISGSSKVFCLGLVTYSNESKTKVLKISKELINKYGGVSKKVCEAMVINVSKIGNSQMSVSITGIAGPGGGSKKKPIGLVYVGIKKRNKIVVNKYIFKSKERSIIQKAAVKKSLKLILNTFK